MINILIVILIKNHLLPSCRLLPSVRSSKDPFFPLPSDTSSEQRKYFHTNLMSFFTLCICLVFRKQTNTRASPCNCKWTEGRLDHWMVGGLVVKDFTCSPLFWHKEDIDQSGCFNVLIAGIHKRNWWLWQRITFALRKKEVIQREHEQLDSAWTKSKGVDITGGLLVGGFFVCLPDCFCCKQTKKGEKEKQEHARNPILPLSESSERSSAAFVVSMKGNPEWGKYDQIVLKYLCLLHLRL